MFKNQVSKVAARKILNSVSSGKICNPEKGYVSCSLGKDMTLFVYQKSSSIKFFVETERTCDPKCFEETVCLQQRRDQYESKGYNEPWMSDKELPHKGH